MIARSLVTALALALSMAGLAASDPHATTHAAPAHAAEHAAASSKGQLTFNRDIAPIVFSHCSMCHRPGESAPFSLLNYDDVKKHARQIVAVTSTHFMPPWPPEPQAPALRFDEDRHLTDHQIALIAKWVDEGMQQGNPADLPPPPHFVPGWQLGEPDLVVTARKPFRLPATGTDVYWNFILPLGLTQDRWVKGIEIRPGDKRLIHHANMVVDRLELSRKLEKEPGAGYGGMEVLLESNQFGPNSSHFLFWKPGTMPYFEPHDMAIRIDKGSDLILKTHLQPSGKPEWIQPSVGIYFTDEPATKHPMLFQMACDSLLDIPAGDDNFVITDDFKLPVDVDVLAIYPHAHYLGHDLKATAVLPNGTHETLIHIKHYDLNWQAVYRYAKPVFLPRGTTIYMRYVYDNTDDNLLNPNHPPKRVLGGNRAVDEMAQLGFQVLPHYLHGSAKDPRDMIREALYSHPGENWEQVWNQCSQGGGGCDGIWQVALTAGNAKLRGSGNHCAAHSSLSPVAKK